MVIELTRLRQSNSKTFKLDEGKRQLVVSIGSVHYKDNYNDETEPWKDIDLSWEGNRITKAPFELTLEGNKATIKDKKTGEISTIELLEVGGQTVQPLPWQFEKGLAKSGDFEIKVEYGHVRFVRILRTPADPVEAKFKVTGNFRVHAKDMDDELPVVSTLKDGILTERLEPDREVKYPVRIDPTWQVGASSDDTFRRLTTSAWDLTQTVLVVGALDATLYQYGSGMRFTNVTIPNATTIDNAKLTLRAERSASGTIVYSRISAEDVDDAPTFADSAATFDTRWAARTTARVDWDAIEVWTIGVDYDSPEIKTVIQEIVDRGGWNSGQDIVIFWDDFEDRTSAPPEKRRFCESWDGSSTYAPKLIITYLLSESKSASMGAKMLAARGI